MLADPTQAPFLPMEQHGYRGYEARCKYDERFEVTQYHCHDFYELYIHICGGEYMGVDNRLFQLKPNQVFILPPFCMHGLSCTREMHNYRRGYLNISPEVMRAMGCGLIDLEQFFSHQTATDVCTYQLSDEDAQSYVSWIRQIEENGKNSDTNVFDRFRDCTAMINLLNLLCQTISRNNPMESAAFDNGTIQEILTYINNHYTQPIRMENLARSFGVSISWLSHEFVRFTNRSVYDYVLYRRVMLARQQMLGTAPLNDIAYQCGFNDYSNFLRSFTRIIGKSPSQFRKEMKKYRKLEVDKNMQL